MTVTYAKENSYQFSELKAKDDQLLFTNSSARTMLFRELVVVSDANDKLWVGFIADPDGVAAGASGLIDLMQEKEIATNQFTAGSFVALDMSVFIVPQTDSDPASITQATASGSVQLDARIISYDASGVIRLRMPVQTGMLTAAA